MYYYLLSNFFHWDENAQKNDPNYPHAKKNILIFMLGSIAYLFTAGFLWSKQFQPLVDSVLPLSIIKDFFMWFMFIDVATCFALFRTFWGHGLMSEITAISSAEKRPKISEEELKIAASTLLVTPTAAPIEEKSSKPAEGESK